MISEPFFGRLLTAMVTPFKSDNSLDLAAAKKLSAYLVDQMANDSLVINGTTGEAPTTTDAEKAALIAEVKAEVGDRAKILAGVGTYNTAHSIELAKQAEAAGADGLLVVTPFYSKPPQDALIEHFVAIADATELPVVLYDIPKRAGIAIEESTIIELAAHPKIVGVKDAKGDVISSSKVIAATDLSYYSGDDAYTLPLLSVGGVGVIGTSTHFTGAQTKQMISAFLAGDLSRAVEINQRMLPVYTGVFATQGAMLVKAGLASKSMPVGGLRPPLKPASTQQAETFAALLQAAEL